MRWAFLALACLAGGCVANNPPRPVTLASRSPQPVYAEPAAASLVFTPPIAMGLPPVHLPREQRAPGAFVGFEDLTTTYFYLRIDDLQQTDDNIYGGSYRRAVSEKMGVTYR